MTLLVSNCPSLRCVLNNTKHTKFFSSLSKHSITAPLSFDSRTQLHIVLSPQLQIRMDTRRLPHKCSLDINLRLLLLPKPSLALQSIWIHLDAHLFCSLDDLLLRTICTDAKRHIKALGRFRIDLSLARIQSFLFLRNLCLFAGDAVGFGEAGRGELCMTALARAVEILQVCERLIGGREVTVAKLAVQ